MKKKETNYAKEMAVTASKQHGSSCVYLNGISSWSRLQTGCKPEHAVCYLLLTPMQQVPTIFPLTCACIWEIKDESIMESKLCEKLRKC